MIVAVARAGGTHGPRGASYVVQAASGRSLGRTTDILESAPMIAVARPHGAGRASDRQMHMTRILTTLGDLELLEACHTTHCFPPHWHDAWAMGIAEDGLHVLTYRDRAFTVSGQTAVIIPAREVHWAVPAGRAGWSYRMLYVQQAALERFPAGRHLVTHSEGIFRSPLFAQPEVLRALDELLALVALSRTSGADVLGDGRVFGEVLASLARVPHDHAPAASPLRHTATRTVLAYLADRPTEGVRLSALAAMAHMSPFHLLRVFRRDTGMTPHAYQRQLRLRRAERMLRTGIPVSHVAFASGFSDQSHLTRTLKAVTGVTPARFAIATTTAP
jgi:AraC-like DNA-binding protein